LFPIPASPSHTRLIEGVVMDSLYVSGFSAAIAAAIIGYSLFLAYA
jgi:hypothetical protein